MSRYSAPEATGEFKKNHVTASDFVSGLSFNDVPAELKGFYLRGPLGKLSSAGQVLEERNKVERTRKQTKKGTRLSYTHTQTHTDTHTHTHSPTKGERQQSPDSALLSPQSLSIIHKSQEVLTACETPVSNLLEGRKN